MYTISVPLSMETVTEESLPLFGAYLRQCGAKRVFLCCVGEVYCPESMLYTEPGRIKKAIAFFRDLGMEVGIWVNSFGHGELLAHEEADGPYSYTAMEDIAGGTAPRAFCPLDPQFTADFQAGIRQLATFGPDLIMLDDDMRFHIRKKYFRLACFCPRHMAWYRQILDEDVRREEIYEKIFTGGRNRYRDAYLNMIGRSLLDFAAKLRAAVDDVDPSIRLGGCMTSAIWDFSGTDVVELSRVLAGNTRPFARIGGAPYWDSNIVPIIEASRQQCAWGAGKIELFCEGDTYPRPRYNVPSRPLELFDLAMLCDGSAGGMLQYLFDYNHSVTYEQGYAQRLVRNMPLRRQAESLFAGKQPVGVQVFEQIHKFRDWELPNTQDTWTTLWFHNVRIPCASAKVLSANSIPTAFGATEFPLLLLGENARYVSAEQLRNGAIIDVTAARILQDRGIDTGLLEAEQAKFHKEYFPKEEETVRGIGGRLYRMTCAGTPESYFLPDNTPASYRYENADGLRFFLMGMAYYTPGEPFPTNYLQSWCRRRQLVEVVSWLCGKPLPVVLPDAPNAYVLASSNGRGMAVAVLNISLDEIVDPVLQLDKAYTRARYVNCRGALDGEKVCLETIPPFGFAAFEVY